MPVSNYKVFSWGNPVGEGVMGSVHVAVSGVAKRASAAMPLTVTNELICAELGRAIRLPIPPSFLVYNNDGVPFHVSLNFLLSGEDLPPANPAAVVQDDPDLACGVILFDAWICNGDRHRKNLAYDTVNQRLSLFDHSHALLSGGDPRARLEGCKTQASIHGHCLAPHLVSLDGFAKWHDRMMAVPEFYVRECLQQTVGIGTMTDELAQFTGDFLLDRRGKLLGLIQAIKQSFPKVENGLWNGLNGGGQ